MNINFNKGVVDIVRIIAVAAVISVLGFAAIQNLVSFSQPCSIQPIAPSDGPKHRTFEGLGG